MPSLRQDEGRPLHRSPRRRTLLEVAVYVVAWLLSVGAICVIVNHFLLIVRVACQVFGSGN